MLVSSITLYGIPNCQTVKKARDWLTMHQINYTFYDFKKQGVNADLLNSWLSQFGIEQLINRSGMTFRNLSDSQKQDAQVTSSAMLLMMQNPSMIKRPILDDSKQIYLGFKEELYQSVFNKS
jgi:Spx/MgsR family transcriptional regulator